MRHSSAMANVDNEDSGNLDQQEFNLFAESSVTVEVHNFLSARLRAPVYVIVIFYFSLQAKFCQDFRFASVIIRPIRWRSSAVS